MIGVLLAMFRKTRNDRKGLETVEMAINLPILLYIVFACIIFLLSMYAKIVVIDAAREGARAAAILITAGSDEDRKPAAEAKIRDVLEKGGLNPDNLNLTDTQVIIDGDTVEVRVVYNQPCFAPGLPMLVGGEPWQDYFILSGSSVFKKETPSP